MFYNKYRIKYIAILPVPENIQLPSLTSSGKQTVRDTNVAKAKHFEIAV